MKVKDVIDGYKDGQEIFRRPSVTVLVERIAELERVLRLVEFCGDYPYDPCHWCSGNVKNGHTPDCPRQQVLGE